jgi:hypothetical protein
MIVKILGSASSNFHGVQYNDKKVEKGTGELMLMKTFPPSSMERAVRAGSGLFQIDLEKRQGKKATVSRRDFHQISGTSEGGTHKGCGRFYA